MSRIEVLDRIRTSLAQLTDEGQVLTAGVELPPSEAADGVVDGQPHRRGIVIDARNLASLRLAECVGMRQEAHLVENEWFKGALE